MFFFAEDIPGAKLLEKTEFDSNITYHHIRRTTDKVTKEESNGGILVNGEPWQKGEPSFVCTFESFDDAMEEFESFKEIVYSECSNYLVRLGISDVNLPLVRRKNDF